MKIDMHTHSLPVSLCAGHQPEELPEVFKAAGYGAFVLTNHYYPYHCDRLSDNLDEQAQIFVETFNRCKKKGDEIGVKVFFGAEIRLIGEPNKPEFLLYGLSQKDFIETYPLYNLTQKELFDFCEQKDILLIQAHPLRYEKGFVPADMNCLHGIEVYNPHSPPATRFEETLKIALENNKIKVSGSDFHLAEEVGIAGMIIPDYIDDQFMLRDYLKNGEIIIVNRDGIFYQNV